MPRPLRSAVMTIEEGRRRIARREVRERVLAAAAALFSERGIAGATIDDIGARAGFSKGAIYSNFASKSELVVQLMDTQVAEQLGTTASRLTAELTADQVVDVIREELGPITPERRRAFALAAEFRLYTERHPEALAEFVRLRARTHDTVRDMVTGYLKYHPEIDLGISPDDVASLANGLVIGLAFNADVPGTPPAGDLIMRVLAALLR